MLFLLEPAQEAGLGDITMRSGKRGVTKRCEFIIGEGEHQGQKCGVPFQATSIVSGKGSAEKFCEEHRGLKYNARGRAGLHTGSNKHYQTQNAETMHQYLVAVMARSFGDADQIILKDDLTKIVQEIISEHIEELGVDDTPIEDLQLSIAELKEENEKLQRQLVILSNRLTDK